MIPYRYKEDELWNAIATNEREAIDYYQKFNKNVKFHAAEYSYRYFLEREVIFSRAIAKFQHLMIIEDCCPLPYALRIIL